MTLWRRDWSLQVGVPGEDNTSLLIAPADGDPLTVSFDISKSLRSRDPNKAKIEVFNLSQDRRDQIAQMDDPQIEFIAGYVDGLTETIFLGDARDHWSEARGTEWVTVFEAEDGGSAYRDATVNQSFGPGTPLATVITACAQAMGVGLGNTTSIAATAELDSGGNVYPSGTQLSGRAVRELERLCRSASLRWSLQTGVLQLRGAGRAAEVSAALLTQDAGLIDSPTRGRVDRRTRRVTYNATSLLRPGLYPGRVATILSKGVNGNLLIKAANYVGVTTENDWFVELELQEYDA
jgi:hypothetical protein